MPKSKAPTTVEGTFRAMRKLFANKKRWTKCYAAQDEDGSSVDERDKSAVCFCLLGGARKVQPKGDLLAKTMNAMDKSIGVMGKKWQDCDPVAFNDSSYTTIEDVREFLDINIKLAHFAGV